MDSNLAPRAGVFRPFQAIEAKTKPVWTESRAGFEAIGFSDPNICFGRKVGATTAVNNFLVAQGNREPPPSLPSLICISP
jgi:hypothetical protein